MDPMERPEEFIKIIMGAKPDMGRPDMEPGHHGPIEGSPAVPDDPIKLLECIGSMINDFLCNGSSDASIKRSMDTVYDDKGNPGKEPDADKKEEE